MLRELLSQPVSDSERARISFLLGQPATLRKNDALTLQKRFEDEGVYAAMDVTDGRGDDFAINQRQGSWAERLFLSYRGPVRFVHFGLSDPVAPADPAYGPTRRKHRCMLLLEGKRPDLLVFETATIEASGKVPTWADELLSKHEVAFLRSKALAGLEIKSSLYHYGRRQQYRATSGAPDLSITVKEEEFRDLERWENKHDTPIVIMQVFVDRIYFMSYRKFQSTEPRFRIDPKTKKRTGLVPIDRNAPRFANIAVTLTDYDFNPDEKGAPKPPGQWPPAKLTNTKLPDFFGLKERHRRRSKPA